MDTGSNSINITLPTSWQELSQKQLIFVFKLLAMDLTEGEVQTHCLLRFGNLRLIRQLENDCFLLKQGKSRFATDSLTVAALADKLSFISSLPHFPVRCNAIGRNKALPADFQGVPFEQYIVCDNLFQGFLQTKDDKLLEQLCRELYGIKVHSLSLLNTSLKRWHLINAFYWFASLKQLLSATFCHFLKPSGSALEQNLLGTSIEVQLTEAMNAQIRALTKGDVTKEHEVLALDTWRALTELDALVKDAEEMESKYNK